ncbi:hypothetical protein ACMG4P_03635 [Pseudovibrio denitrificans]|uniref:hypothetical protein n=1 Tax=Pseudovibrio denitrificans TaxID=258256 RepID=UPI0039BED71F
MRKLRIPNSISEYINEHEFWETNIGDAEITIEETEYNGEDKISFQVSISNGQNGLKLETQLLEYADQQNPKLSSHLLSDSESSVCVLWTDDQVVFEKFLDLALAYLEKN